MKIIVVIEDSKTNRAVELIDMILKNHYIWHEIGLVKNSK